jgi:hypothetical protein
LAPLFGGPPLPRDDRDAPRGATRDTIDERAYSEAVAWEIIMTSPTLVLGAVLTVVVGAQAGQAQERRDVARTRPPADRAPRTPSLPLRGGFTNSTVVVRAPSRPMTLSHSRAESLPHKAERPPCVMPIVAADPSTDQQMAHVPPPVASRMPVLEGPCRPSMQQPRR